MTNNIGVPQDTSTFDVKPQYCAVGGFLGTNHCRKRDEVPDALIVYIKDTR